VFLSLKTIVRWDRDRLISKIKGLQAKLRRRQAWLEDHLKSAPPIDGDGDND
jgi:hypothetical protein